MSMDVFACAGIHASSSRALVTSNHSDWPYISQWYGANGARPSAENTCIAAAVGALGTDRTFDPVPAWTTSASSVSRIVPNSTAPTLYVVDPGRSPARLHASARSDACTNWYTLPPPPSTKTGPPAATSSNNTLMIPRRPWPRMVRGRMTVTSSPLATASAQSSSPRSFARPYASRGRAGVSSVTGFASGRPNTALDDV